MGFLEIAQQFNIINMINLFAPAGIGEIVVLVLCGLALIVVFLFLQILKATRMYIWNMYEAYRTGGTLLILPMDDGKVYTDVAKPEQSTYMRESATPQKSWALKQEGIGQLIPGVMYSLLLPDIGVGLTYHQLGYMARDKSDLIKSIPGPGEVYVNIYEMAMTLVSKIQGGNWDTFMKYWPYLMALGLVILAIVYLFGQPQSVECVFQGAGELVATTTSTLGTAPPVGVIT